MSSTNNVSNKDQSLTNQQLPNIQIPFKLTLKTTPSKEQTAFEDEINTLINELITYTQNEHKFKSLVGEVLLELKAKVELQAHTRVKAWANFVKYRLHHIMSYSTADKYMRFHANYDKICDMWEKLGKHIDGKRLRVVKKTK